MHAIVCEDPSRRHNVGTIVEGAQEVALLKRQGVALLPFDPETPRLANTGYIQTFFGKGWLFDRNVGERGCPSMLHITRTCRVIYWAARVQPLDPKAHWGVKMRLVHSSDNQRGLGRGMNQIDRVEETPTLNDKGYAVVYGKSVFDTESEGLLFTDLYANATNCVVLWSAMTQHQQDYQWSSVG